MKDLLARDDNNNDNELLSPEERLLTSMSSAYPGAFEALLNSDLLRSIITGLLFNDTISEEEVGKLVKADDIQELVRIAQAGVIVAPPAPPLNE